MQERGRSFGVAAAEYERGRPEWPAELLDAVPLGPEATVVDLGAGTGKLTRLLAQRFARVIAIEPDEEMRALIAAGEPVAGTAEAIPVGDASVDGVFSGDAFHWFELERALAEIGRVLRPGGVLAILWNRYDHDHNVLPDGVLPESGPGAHTFFTSDEWRAVVGAEPFEPLREVARPQELDAPREALLDYFASISPVTSLPPAERERALGRIAAALDRPVYRRRWTAVAYWTRRA